MVGALLDPRRFRPNIVIDVAPAWCELAMLGETIQRCDAVFKVE